MFNFEWKFLKLSMLMAGTHSYLVDVKFLEQSLFVE